MVYFIGELNQKPIILTFDEFDRLILLNKSIWTHSTWLVIFLTNHKMVFLTSQIGPKKWAAKKIN
jgi:hypothetical protein